MNSLIFITLILTILILVLLIISKKRKEEYQFDLSDQIINLILFTPLSTRTLLDIIYRYQGEGKKDYIAKLREIIGFLRSNQFKISPDYFKREARRYLTSLKDLDNNAIFTPENLKHFTDGITDEIKKIAIGEDDLD